MKYLGAPLVAGWLKVNHFDEVVARVRERLVGWQNNLLSNGARIILLRQLISSILIHLLSIVHAPKMILNILNRLTSNFFGGFSYGKPKRKWVAWQKICKPTKEGGLGLQSLEGGLGLCRPRITTHEVSMQFNGWGFLMITIFQSQVHKRKSHYAG